MNAFIDECLAAGVQVKGGPMKAVSLEHHMDKTAGIKDLFIHMFYRSCEPNVWKIHLAIAMSIKTCKYTDDEPVCKDTLISTKENIGPPTKAKLVELTVGLIKMLKTMKFDKLTGNFTPTLPYFVPELSSAEDCCVCMEKTKTKTSCGHTLCCECWHQLKTDICPVCRNEDIVYCKCEYDCDSPNQIPR